MLEMSFYKFLEQFFYNQDLVSTGQLTQIQSVYYNKEQMCPHSFNIDCSMVFKHGPIKIMFNFQPLDEYSIDLTHFGTMSGIFSKAQLREKALFQMKDLIR